MKSHPEHQVFAAPDRRYRWKPCVRPLVDWLTSGRRSVNDPRFTPRTKHVITPVYETPRRHVADGRRLDIRNQPTFTNATRRFYYEGRESPPSCLAATSPCSQFQLSAIEGATQTRLNTLKCKIHTRLTALTYTGRLLVTCPKGHLSAVSKVQRVKSPKIIKYGSYGWGGERWGAIAARTTSRDNIPQSWTNLNQNCSSSHDQDDNFSITAFCVHPFLEVLVAW